MRISPVGEADHVLGQQLFQTGQVAYPRSRDERLEQLPVPRHRTTAVELFTDDERAALVGFLAGYSGQTRNAYNLDLRQFTSWCATHGLHLFNAKRADIECYARDLEPPVGVQRARAIRTDRMAGVAVGPAQGVSLALTGAGPRIGGPDTRENDHVNSADGMPETRRCHPPAIASNAWSSGSAS